MKEQHRKQGSKIVIGESYDIYRCSDCGCLVPKIERFQCYNCDGKMLYIGNIIMQQNSLPDEYTPMRADFEWFVENHDSLLEIYNGKYLAIKNKKVISCYDDQAIAINETMKKHELGTFSVQLCTPGDEAYTHTIL